MSRLQTGLLAAVKAAGPKPNDADPQATKRNYNQKLSNNLALSLADELRRRGMSEARPSGPGEVGLSGAERRLAGGIGAKKVDVSWATEESGLILACSVKTIMFKDGNTRNYQKNLTNRRGDLLIESVTLHRRFPYAVIAGFLILDVGSTFDGTSRRRSTFENAFPRLRLFTRRPDPAARDEQFERLYLLVVDPNPFAPTVQAFEVNNPDEPVDLDDAIEDLLQLIGERNFDLYEIVGGMVTRT